MSLRPETQAALNFLVLRTLRYHKLEKVSGFWTESYKLGDKLTLRRDSDDAHFTPVEWYVSIEDRGWNLITNDDSLIHELEMLANPAYAKQYKSETELLHLCRALVDDLAR